MQEDSFEKKGNRNKEKSEYYERWADSMDDAPAFAGEDEEAAKWDYFKLKKAEAIVEDNADDTPNKKYSSHDINSEKAPGSIGDLNEASKITSYGFDVAAKNYGLGQVLKAIVTTDETGRDVENPIGVIYEKIVPGVEARKKLFHEIQKTQYQDDDESKNRVSMDGTGNIYERSQNDRDEERAIRSIQSVKNLIIDLQTQEKFKGLRDRAEATGTDVISLLTKGIPNPTLTNFLDGIGNELANLDDSEEITKLVDDSSSEKLDGEPEEKMKEKSGVEMEEKPEEKLDERVGGEMEEEAGSKLDEDSDQKLDQQLVQLEDEKVAAEVEVGIGPTKKSTENLARLQDPNLSQEEKNRIKEEELARLRRQIEDLTQK